MKIAIISGTPGCGKSTTSKKISSMISAKVISLNKIVKSENYTIDYDTVRDTFVADFNRLIPHIQELIENYKRKNLTYLLIESHYADIVPRENVDIAFVLRCDPDELYSRLKQRGYSMGKIKENIQSEILGTCANYILEKEINVPKLEIDTTNKSVKETARLIIDLLKSQKDLNNFRIGKIDWLEKLNKEGRLNKFFD
jgi:adenylate kinase